MKAGITGHQNLGDQATIAWVKETLADLVVENNVSHGFTCLLWNARTSFSPFGMADLREVWEAPGILSIFQNR